MRFRSTTGEDIHIALLSGQTAIVGADLTELDKAFHKEAIARGCLPEGVEPDAPVVDTGFKRRAAIESVINEMLNGSNEKDFNTNGKPDLRALNARVGFQVARDEADAIWDKMEKA